jgi:hypothetical protein
MRRRTPGIVGADEHRTADRRGVASGLLGVAIQQRVALGGIRQCLLGRDVAGRDAVPHVGVLRRDPQRAWAVCGNREWRPWLLHRPGRRAHAVRAELGPLVVGFAAENGIDDRHGVAEPLDLLRFGQGIDAEDVVVEQRTAGADAQLEAPARDLIDGHRLVRQYRRMAEDR